MITLDPITAQPQQYLSELACAEGGSATSLVEGARLSSRPVCSWVLSVPSRAGQLRLDIEGEAPPWLGDLMNELGALLELPAGWNSYGARQVDPRIAADAVRLLLTVMREDTPVPALVPTSRGGIQAEWHSEAIDLEVEVIGPYNYQVSYEDIRSGTEWEAQITFDLSRLAECVSGLSRRGKPAQVA
jgi:hypothetical protein